MPQKAVAIGIIPIAPILFWDWDKDTQHAYSRLKAYAEMWHRKMVPRHYQIFSTKHGYHLVSSSPTYTEVNIRLRELQEMTKEKYIMDAKKLRLRFSAKFSQETGYVLSPEPKLITTCCLDLKTPLGHDADLRFNGSTTRQVYFTWEK